MRYTKVFNFIVRHMSAFTTTLLIVAAITGVVCLSEQRVSAQIQQLRAETEVADARINAHMHITNQRIDATNTRIDSTSHLILEIVNERRADRR